MFHTEQFTDAFAAETRTRIIIVHEIRKLERHQADARLQTRISEEHIDQFRHFMAYSIRIIRNDSVVSTRISLIDRFNLADNRISDRSILDQLIRTFDRLLHADAESQLLCFLIIRCLDAVGCCKAGRCLQIFTQFSK